MRFVDKDLSDIPDIFNKPSVIAELAKIVNGKTDLIRPKVYKGEYKRDGKTESSVRDKLNIYYYTKCAYCEMHCKAEIEHYRPKLGVAEDNTHSGYYWLCYEWSNLLPSCRYCNTEGGKGTKFPINGYRVTHPPVDAAGKLESIKCIAKNDPLILENANLLHPEIDDPTTFLGFESDPEKKGIKIIGVDAQQRGSETIRICNLNREYAKLSRLEAVLHPFIVEIDRVFEYINKGLMDIANIGKALKLCFEQVIRDSQNVTLTHTLLRWFILKDNTTFGEIVLPLIENISQKEIVSEAFNNYKSGNL